MDPRELASAIWDEYEDRVYLRKAIRFFIKAVVAALILSAVIEIIIHVVVIGGAILAAPLWIPGYLVGELALITAAWVPAAIYIPLYGAVYGTRIWRSLTGRSQWRERRKWSVALQLLVALTPLWAVLMPITLGPEMTGSSSDMILPFVPILKTQAWLVWPALPFAVILIANAFEWWKNYHGRFAK